MRRIPIQVGGSSEYAIMISCCNSDGITPGLAVFDGEKIESIDSRSTTGICIGDERLFRLLQVPDSEGMTQLLVYDAEGNVDTWPLKGVRDPHDVIWDGTHVVVVSTDDNSVKWIAPGGETVREWTVPAEADAWHLNCLGLQDSHVFVSAFGEFAEHRGWAKETRKETGILIQPDTGQIVISGLVQPHSPRYHEGSWIICSSLNREVHQYTPTGQLIRRSDPLALYARGIAITDDFLFVGESVPRPNNFEREDVVGKTASIAVLSRDNWALVDRILFPCWEMYELLVVKRSLVNAVRYRGIMTRYITDIAEARHRADAEIMEIRRQTEAELADAHARAEAELAEVRQQSAVELERMQAAVSGLQCQIAGMKSARGARLVLKARAAQALLRQKGPLGLLKRMVRWNGGKRGNHSGAV